MTQKKKRGRPRIRTSAVKIDVVMSPKEKALIYKHAKARARIDAGPGAPVSLSGFVLRTVLEALDAD